jgi:hypothetical protein
MLFAWNRKESWAPLATAVAGQRARHRVLARMFPQAYEGVLVYHACRPDNVSSYYTDGLRRSSSAALDVKAREIFLSGEFPEITSARLDTVIADLGGRDEGRIFACLDRDHVLVHASHYLIYGSERMCAIAAALSGQQGRDYRQILKRHGRPTLLHVALDWQRVSDSDLKAFAKLVSANLARIKAQQVLPEAWFSFEFFDSVPPSAILAHEHPEKMVDPLLGMVPYVFRTEYSGSK